MNNMLSGYCEIYLGGKKRGVKFGMNAFALACELAGLSLEEFGKSMDSNQFVIRELLWAGLVSNCRSKNIAEDFNLYNVGDWMDEISSDSFDTVMDTISKAQFFGKKLQAEPVEKKVKAK